MRTDLLRSTTLALGLLTATFSWAQNPGPSPQGQVPGPNATQPQADDQSPDGGTSVQPVAGAMPGSDTVPSTLSEKKAADDKLITVAWTFKNLNDEQRRTIYEALKGQPPSGVSPSAEMGVELPSSFELRPVPRAVVARIPQTDGYQYTVSGDKVFLVSPANRIVVGEISQ
jgi:hypothetical protein